VQIPLKSKKVSRGLVQMNEEPGFRRVNRLLSERVETGVLG